MGNLIIEQDGTVSTVHRLRERNLDRAIVAITDAPVEAQLDWLRPLSTEQQLRGITTMLSNSRSELLAAIAAHDLPGIVEGKARASAIQEIARHLKLSREIQYDATEFVRRAERGLGVAIREGQARGDILTRSLHAGDNVSSSIMRPTDFAAKDDLATGKNGIYAMTDGITDEQFEEALASARADGNLSRAHVVRKARGIANLPVQPVVDEEKRASGLLKKVRKTAAARRVMESLAIDINSLVFVINETNPQEVDAELHKSDIADIRAGLGVIRKFITEIEKERDS